jgi:hypothetical protein
MSCLYGGGFVLSTERVACASDFIVLIADKLFPCLNFIFIWGIDAQPYTSFSDSSESAVCLVVLNRRFFFFVKRSMFHCIPTGFVSKLVS